ncbi:MAG: hypothetical protein HGA78_04930 [Nitrospirales bacterium]|nr:hypothetical protein [Nitrospirales bacterium]
MRFKVRGQKSEVRSQTKEGRVFFSSGLSSVLCALASVICLLSSVLCSAEVIDRVVASVDDRAITLSELQETSREMTKAHAMTENEVLSSMINRLLLLREAKKMRFEGASDDEIIREYLDIKIRSLILIKEEAIRKFYADNMDKWGGKDYLDVRDDSERYLFEKEFNDRLKKHLEELREKSEITIMLDKNSE